MKIEQLSTLATRARDSAVVNAVLVAGYDAKGVVRCIGDLQWIVDRALVITLHRMSCGETNAGCLNASLEVRRERRETAYDNMSHKYVYRTAYDDLNLIINLANTMDQARIYVEKCLDASAQMRIQYGAIAYLVTAGETLEKIL